MVKFKADVNTTQNDVLDGFGGRGISGRAQRRRYQTQLVVEGRIPDP